MGAKFKIGDTVWYGQACWLAIPKKCPVCQGTGRVLIKPIGADDSIGNQALCKYCKPHHEGQVTGTVVEDWDWNPHIQSMKIEGINIEEKRLRGSTVTEIRYLYNVTGCSNNSITEDRVRATREEAMAYAEEHVIHVRAAKAKEAEDRPLMSNREANRSWDVGYYRKQIKTETAILEKAENDVRSATRSLEHAKVQLCLMEAKDKTPLPEPPAAKPRKKKPANEPNA